MFRWPWSPDNPPIKRNVIDVLISPEVFRGIVFVFIASGSALFGYSQQYQPPTNTTGSGQHESLSWKQDPNFHNLLWQVIFQLVASYCTLVPVIRDVREANEKGSRSKGKTGRDSIYDATFYTCIATSVITAFMAPFIYAGTLIPEAATISNVLNFISTVFSVIAASQLAGKICPGTLNRSWKDRRRHNHEGDNTRV